MSWFIDILVVFLFFEKGEPQQDNNNTEVEGEFFLKSKQNINEINLFFF